MAKLQRNFIKGKMNKGLDERLVPNGEYIDALNVRVGTTELSEIGAVENSRGNERLTTLRYENTTLSSSAKCIGAFEDGANDTIYWFVTDSAHTGGQATNKLDMIVSYNMINNSVKYHVISVDDGGGTNTTLNFNSQYLITGVDKIDDLLFFTDNFNQPRFINVTSSYAYPATNIDGGSSAAAALLAESLLVVKKPPVNSPAFTLLNRGSEQNFLEDKFICFAYRYRYADDMYSATSQFSDVAFIPKAFVLDQSTYLNDGMENSFDTAIINFNTGSELVIGIDLLFKESSNSVIKIIEKLDKEELGFGDNEDRTYDFSNNKIYSILDDNEILRLYDNVPIKAKAQTIMDSRLVYGNYTDGFDVNDVKLEYEVDYISNILNVQTITTTRQSGAYSIRGNSTSIPNSEMVFDFNTLVNTVGLESGGRLDIQFSFSHHSFFNVSGTASSASLQTSSKNIFLSYTFPQDFPTGQDLQFNQDFNDVVGRNGQVNPPSTSCSGTSFTDIVNCEIPLTKVDGNGRVFTKIESGISNALDGMAIGGATPPNQVTIKLIASVYQEDGGTDMFVEYYQITAASSSYQSIADNPSLHSNRDYEVGIIYMDDYNRSTTVLVSKNNVVYIPCSNSSTQNFLRVNIGPNQLPPSWATRYKFAIKQNKDIYETIYSNIYFYDPESTCYFFLIQGENAQKVEVGDTLIVKKDGNGPLNNCVFVDVLEKEAKEGGFLEHTDPITNQIIKAPAGVYMKTKNNNFVLNNTGNALGFLDFGEKSSTINNNAISNGILSAPFIVYQGFNNIDTSSGRISLGDSIPRGTKIEFFIEAEISLPDWMLNYLSTFCAGGTNLFYTLTYTYDKSFTTTVDYTDIINWWNTNNIADNLKFGSEVLDTNISNLSCLGSAGLPVDPTPGFFLNNIVYTPTVETDLNAATQRAINTLSPVSTDFTFQWFRDPVTNFISLIVRSLGTSGISSSLKIHCKMTRPGELLAFETEAQDTAPDIFFESSVSYPITNGFHTGNVQTQTASLPAIIETEFQNCFTFGNGVESYKIRDSVTRSRMSIGNRTSAILKGEDFREVHRFSDLTYSGVYSFNVNNLNEFNLGLLNFKSLEPSFGEIQKIFARATDILILQEDKISYVLAGKNLLSDAAAGGVITSVPEVLGTQIARLEEYGIGDNPESFASYGYDKYFTDSKRGVVIQLKGSSYNNDQLTVISNFGLGSWFRNLFIDFPNTQKLGAYDPYMKEYVLSSPNIELPFTPVLVEGGIKQKFLVTPTKSVSYTVDLGQTVGLCTVSYNVSSITPGDVFNVVVTYDSNPPVVEVLNGLGTGSFTVNKSTVDPQTATVSIVYAPPGDPNPNASLDLEITVENPSADTLNVFQVCISDDNDSDKTIHNEYRWSSGSFNSALHSNFVSLAEGTASPLVSQYNKIIGPQGGNIVPIDGATVELISNRLQSDNFAFDSSVNNFAQLRTATLYNNTPADIASLLAAASNVAASGSGGVFTGSFTMPSGSNNDNLYLIYDYRKPVAVTLCYSNTSADDACCTCGTSATYYIDGPTLDKATAVYTSSSLTTKATDGWYSTGGFNRKQTSGLLEINTLCSACNLACGTTLSMDTSRGFYTVNIDLGSATGAVVLDIDFKGVPDGVKVEYNGVTYNSIYSPNFGFINSPAANPLYTGITAFDCSISGSTFPSLIDYQFNGNGFNKTGTIKSVTVDPTSVFLKATGLGTCKMIIPKAAASPSIATMTIISPCDKSEIEITPACPTALSAWESYQAAPSATNASGLCTVGAVTTYYHVVVGGSAGNPGVGDIIYTDANGTTLAGAGFYSVVGAAVIQVDANGVVASTPSCVP
jgi:hypothetical protein